MVLLLRHKLTVCAVSILMCVDKQSVDGILHGTETLEQNYVLLHTWTRRRLGFFCREKIDGIYLETNLRTNLCLY